MAQTQDDFADFVRQTGIRLYRTALLLTGDHQLAEDLTQATYTKVFASWRRVRRADNPVGYTHTILLNTFLSHRRLRRNREVPVADFSDTATTPDTDTRLDLLAALARLSPSDRAVLVARYWEDRSIAQTAGDLRMSEAAVRTRTRRALDRIRPIVSERTTP
jgi:RNA polymerase sigma-70 factor (sigma-E family)